MRGDRIVSGVVLMAAVLFAVLGAWAFAAPRSFFDAIATFEPYNAHFVRDIGAFQIGFAAALAAALRTPSALVAGLFGTGFGTAVHTFGHVLDRDLGGRTWLDIPSLAILGTLLLWAAWRAGRRAG